MGPGAVRSLGLESGLEAGSREARDQTLLVSIAPLLSRPVPTAGLTAIYRT